MLSREVAPVDVCIVIDDVHELPAMSAGQALVSDLATRLPAHGHLVLASREPVQTPLARRRAAGQVVEVGPDALAFSDAEITALARMLGEDPAACRELAGWPSLVRLVLSAPPGALRQFLWEEIVARLPSPEQSGLLALAVLGSGSDSEVAAVAGEEIDIDRLMGSVPLLYQDAQGRFGAHQLWEDAAERIFPAAQIANVRRRALQTLRERGETVRMGSAAARWQDAHMFCVACVSLVLESLGALPIDTADRWLASTPPGAVGTPEQQLLGLALRHAQRREDDDLDAELDQLEADFQDRGDEAAQAVTLALASVVAHGRGDQLRLLLLAERIRALPRIAAQPLLLFLVHAVDAALSSLTGDVDGALDTIASMSFKHVPQPVGELVTRLHVVMLQLAGRADEAVPIASSLLESPRAYVRSMPSMARWWAGDPSEHLAAPPVGDPLLDLNHRDRFVWSAYGVVVAASLGDRALMEVMRHELEAAAGSSLDGRDGAIASGSLACYEILAHDEEAARTVIADHLTHHPLSDRLGEVHLRRTLAVAYICDDRVRRCWDDTPLGRVHLRARAAARQFLAAREGRLDCTDTTRIIRRDRYVVTARLVGRACRPRHRRRPPRRRRPLPDDRVVAALADAARGRMADRQRRRNLSPRRVDAHRRRTRPRPDAAPYRRARRDATAARRSRTFRPRTATRPRPNPARPAGTARSPSSPADLRPALARPRTSRRRPEPPGHPQPTAAAARAH